MRSALLVAILLRNTAHKLSLLALVMGITHFFTYAYDIQRMSEPVCIVSSEHSSEVKDGRNIPRELHVCGFFSQDLVLFSVPTSKLGIDALHSLYIKEQLNERDIRRHSQCSARSTLRYRSYEVVCVLLVASCWSKFRTSC